MNQTTWDGLKIAEAAPRGSSIVVRRATDTGFEYPLLHRAATGPRSHDLWSWTPPSGMRQPGEAVYPAALRELAEETGLTDIDIHPVDLARGHALWMCDPIPDTRVTLDAEHDDLRWCDPAEAVDLCRPRVVGAGITTVDAIPAVHMAFRPLTEPDFAMLSEWSHRKHLTPSWFQKPMTPQQAADRYRGCLSPDQPIEIHILTINGATAGIAQIAPVADLPEHLAAIGNPDAVAIGFAMADRTWIGRGLGPQLVWSILRHLVTPAHPTATAVVACTAVGNHASMRALHKSGFTRDATVDVGGRNRIVHSLNPGHWLGRD